jgi:hypothetical protein
VLVALAFPMLAGAQEQQQQQQQKQESPSFAPQQAPKGSSDIEVSDKELKKFAGVLQEVQKVQQSYGSDVQSAISESSLEKDRFKEIHSAAQNSSRDQAEGQTESETKAYKKVIGKIRKLQQKSNQQMVKVVKEGGFSVKRFNRIAMALRSDQELGKRLKQFM